MDNKFQGQHVNAARAPMLIKEEPKDEPVTYVTDSFLLQISAAAHFTNNAALARNFTELVIPVKVFDIGGSFLLAKKKGHLHCKTLTGESLILKDVLYSPDIAMNMIAFRQLGGGQMTFGQDEPKLVLPNGSEIQGKFDDDMPMLQLQFEATCPVIPLEDYKLWHDNLKHPSKNQFIAMQENNVFSDGHLLNGDIPEMTCDHCGYGKPPKHCCMTTFLEPDWNDERVDNGHIKQEFMD